MDTGVPCATRRRTVKGSVRSLWRTKGSSSSSVTGHRSPGKKTVQLSTSAQTPRLFPEQYQHAATQEYVFSTYLKYSRILEYTPHGLWPPPAGRPAR
jgi:hypothetical protein